jgi:hypothetical protein
MTQQQTFPWLPNETFTWFIPSVYGDIKLEKEDVSSTRVSLVGLSPTEREAVKALLKHAQKPGVMSNPWATPAEIASVDLGSLKDQSFLLRAPISKVQSFLQKTLKPHRKQLSAVRFANGRIEELTEATLATIDAAPEPVTTEVKKEEKKPAPERAVTVSQPVLGCPAPDFDEVEVRATRVLKAFLAPDQIADFERRQQFVAVGGDTGHRYLLTSRNSRRALRGVSGRSLFDMDENIALCVHDWEVPASEELLTLFVHISIPGLEKYVRAIPDREGVLA